jgi:NADH-quinone oxidoreductase subunit J
MLSLAMLTFGLGLWLLLPRGVARGRGLGTLMAAAGLGLWMSRLHGLGNWTADTMFYPLAALTVVSAVGAITFRNPVYCAIWFGQMLLGITGLFLLIGAQFLAVATVVVYAGAILVAFLFLLMLAQPEGKAPYDRHAWEPPAAAATGVIIAGVMSMLVGDVCSRCGPVARPPTPPTQDALAENVLAANHVARLGGELFGRNLVAVEVVALLLLVALVGAAVIIVRGKDKPINNA